jgi:hypothetical protein
VLHSSQFSGEYLNRTSLTLSLALSVCLGVGGRGRGARIHMRERERERDCSYFLVYRVIFSSCWLV